VLQGIDSDGPVLQLGRNVFSGEYADTLGTKVLFECNSSAYLPEFLTVSSFYYMIKYFVFCAVIYLWSKWQHAFNDKMYHL